MGWESFAMPELRRDAVRVRRIVRHAGFRHAFSATAVGAMRREAIRGDNTYIVRKKTPPQGRGPEASKVRYAARLKRRFAKPSRPSPDSIMPMVEGSGIGPTSGANTPMHPEGHIVLPATAPKGTNTLPEIGSTATE